MPGVGWAYQRANGKTVTITGIVADLTGRPPRMVRELVREHAASYSGETRHYRSSSSRSP
jgi:hypothetical protein